VLVAHLAEDLLQHVGERDQSGHRAELVHHQRHVRVVRPEFSHQLVHWLGFGNHQRLPEKAAQAERARGAMAIVRETAFVPNAHQVFVVDDARNLLGAIIVHRNARELVLGHDA